MDFYLNDIYTALLMYSISFFAIIMFIDKNRLLIMLEYLINQKYAVLYHRKDPPLLSFLGILHILIIFSIGISFYLFSNGLQTSYVSFILIFVTLLCFFMIKLLAIYLLSVIFELPDYYKKYYYEHITSLIFCSMFFLPITIFISYFNDGIIIQNLSLFAACFFGFIYLVSQIVVLNRLNLFSISYIFYNILYLCALEVLPYLVLFNVLGLIN